MRAVTHSNAILAACRHHNIVPLAKYTIPGFYPKDEIQEVYGSDILKFQTSISTQQILDFYLQCGAGTHSNFTIYTAKCITEAWMWLKVSVIPELIKQYPKFFSGIELFGGETSLYDVTPHHLIDIEGDVVDDWTMDVAVLRELIAMEGNKLLTLNCEFR